MAHHPLELFQFCPKCGSSDFEIHNALSRHCNKCGFTYYQNPRASKIRWLISVFLRQTLCTVSFLRSRRFSDSSFDNLTLTAKHLPFVYLRKFFFSFSRKCSKLNKNSPAPVHGTKPILRVTTQIDAYQSIRPLDTFNADDTSLFSQYKLGSATAVRTGAFTDRSLSSVLACG